MSDESQQPPAGPELGAVTGSPSPVTDDAWESYNRGACGLHYIAHKMRGLETEAARLRDIIERACVQFFQDGSDGETAAKMLNILYEGMKLPNSVDMCPRSVEKAETKIP